MVDASISVIIPTWNRSHTIEAAIHSVLDQTVAVSEILICDDGSTDDTSQRVEAIAAQDPRVVWQPGLRGGRPSIPRNRGITSARSEWIAFLDSDDVWLPRKLELQLAAASAQKVDAVCSNAWCVKPGSDSKVLALQIADVRLSASKLFRGNLVQCSSVLLRRRLFEHVLGFPERVSLTVGEDYALWLRVAVLTDFAYISEPLTIYLDDAVNSIRAKSLDGWSERLAVFHDFLDWALLQQPSVAAGLLWQARFEVMRATLRRPLSRAVSLLKRTNPKISKYYE